MYSSEYCEILKTTYFEEYLPTAASVDSFTTFHLQCFDFMSNTVRIINIILTIMLSVKMKMKICLLRQLLVPFHKFTK